MVVGAVGSLLKRRIVVVVVGGVVDLVVVVGNVQLMPVETHLSALNTETRNISWNSRISSRLSGFTVMLFFYITIVLLKFRVGIHETAIQEILAWGSK